MSESNVKGILDITIEKMRAVADADTIIGEQIQLPGNVVIIPVSKVSYGFASGGTDFAVKSSAEKLFGGGGGGGMTVSPIAFLAVKDGDVKVLNISYNQGPADKAVSLVPELFDRIIGLFPKKKTQADPSEE